MGEEEFDDHTVEEIEKIIGYSFRNKRLLRRCFTLSCASAENNERLEFLGDALVEGIVSVILYRETDDPEGEMTRKRQEMVSNARLKDAVERLKLHKYLIYVGSEENLGAKPVASLFESVAAGIYLDGGVEAAKKFVAKNIRLPDNEKERNNKGELQEKLQGEGNPPARYTLISKKGADHCPVFTVSVECTLGTATANGRSMKSAEQAAAGELLGRMKKQR